MLGAQPDDPARHADVAADRLKGSYSRWPTSISRFVHQRPNPRLARLEFEAAVPELREAVGGAEPRPRAVLAEPMVLRDLPVP